MPSPVSLGVPDIPPLPLFSTLYQSFIQTPELEEAAPQPSLPLGLTQFSS